MLAADPSGDGKGEKAFEKVLDVWRRHEVFPLEDIAAVMMAAASTPRPPPTAGHAAAAPLLAPGAYQAAYEYLCYIFNDCVLHRVLDVLKSGLCSSILCVIRSACLFNLVFRQHVLSDHTVLFCTAGYLSFYPTVSLQYSCCDVSVRKKDWRRRVRGDKAT